MASLPLEDEIALDIFIGVTERWSFASPLFADAFKRHDLADEQRESIVVIVREMLAKLRRLDFAIVSARGTVTPIALLLAARVLNGSLTTRQAKRLHGGIDWDEVSTVADRIALLEPAAARFAIECSFPDELAQKFIAEYGDEAFALGHALNLPPPTTLRANTLKNTRAELETRLEIEGLQTTHTLLSPHGLRCENPGRLFSTHAFKEGQFEVQDEGSQLIAELVAPARKSHVIDLCAGSGGKTLALAALMAGTGTLTALDTSAWQIGELQRRARRAGAFNVRALTAPADALPPELAADKRSFARVLVDAPCGGSGALRRNPEARWRGERLDDLARVQESLLRRALEICAAGGRVIYATCSLMRAENEEVVEKVVAGGGCENLAVKTVLGKARDIASPCGRYLKLLPHKHNTDGFFAAVLRKTGGATDMTGTPALSVPVAT